jgi:hypothetical protein
MACRVFYRARTRLRSRRGPRWSRGLSYKVPVRALMGARKAMRPPRFLAARERRTMVRLVLTTERERSRRQMMAVGNQLGISLFDVLERGELNRPYERRSLGGASRGRASSIRVRGRGHWLRGGLREWCRICDQACRVNGGEDHCNRAQAAREALVFEVREARREIAARMRDYSG